MMFYLTGNQDEQLRLKVFTSASRNGKCVIKIEIETASPYHMAQALEDLARVQAGQNPKPTRRPKPLALPAPGES